MDEHWMNVIVQAREETLPVKLLLLYLNNATAKTSKSHVRKVCYSVSRCICHIAFMYCRCSVLCAKGLCGVKNILS